MNERHGKEAHLSGPQLEALAAGEPLGSGAERAEEHLRECVPCRAGLEAVRAENRWFAAELAASVMAERETPMNNVLVANAGTRPENRAWNAAILALAALLMLAATTAFVGLGSWNFGAGGVGGAGGPAGEAALPPGETQPGIDQAKAFLAAPGEAKTEAQARTRARIKRDLRNGPLAKNYLNASAAEALPALRAALHESDGKVRLNAVRSLERMGRSARKAVPDLYAMLRDGGDGNGSLRKAAARALKRIGEDVELKGDKDKDGDDKADDKDKDGDDKADDKDKDGDDKADDKDDDDGKAGKGGDDDDDEADDDEDEDEDEGGSGKAKGGSGAAPEQW